MNRRLTASRLQLAATCAGSALLPSAGSTSSGMSRGTAVHSFLEDCNKRGREEALAAVDDTWRATCAAIDLDGLPLDPKAYLAEVAFSWSPTTGDARVLGSGMDRDYSAAEPDAIVGTVDVVCLIGDDAVGVFDWKSQHDRSVPPVYRNWQMRFYALAAARAYGRDRAIAEIIKPTEDGAWRDRAELDLFDLAGVAEDLRLLVLRLQREELEPIPSLVTGDHCQRCGSLPFCPAHVEMVRSLVASPPDQALATFEANASISPEHRTRAYHGLRALDAFSEKAWAALKGMAAVEPIRVNDEKVYGTTTENRTDITGQVALDVLTERYGADAKQAAKVSVTATAIEKMVVANLPADAKRGARGKVLEEIYMEIDRLGGLRRFPQDVVKVHKAKNGQ